MPELPEVETIRTQLSKHLPFEVLSQATTKELKQNILHTTLNLKNKTIIQIARKGKMLDFVLSDQSHLLSHLGMTGTWLVTETKPIKKHTHLILQGFSKDRPLFLSYFDPRRFGHLYHLSPTDAEKKLGELGLDLVDKNLSPQYIKEVLKKMPQRALKVALLEQKYFAGSGNYIANEICALAGIRPTRKCNRVTSHEISRIHQALKKVITGAIKSGGTTFQGGYLDTTGNKGKGVDNLVVFYQKTCRICHQTPVKKIILNQRGTYYCPKCQS